MNQKLLQAKILRWLSIAPLVFFQMILNLSAQDELDLDEDVYELSPFTIEAEEQGWVATQTLAGSRLRTDFKDIAAQVEVLTMDFMDDFALTSVNEAAIYSVNMENSVDAITGNGLGGNNNNIRIRGLGVPTNSKEFFASLLRSDNYNLERVTVSSGPSSILFGTGSPAGVINTTLKKAFFNDLNKLTVRLDTLGSQRFVFDANKVLVEDKLAVRAIGLFNEQRFDEKPAFDRSKRWYVAATYKPFENTTVHASFEDFEREQRTPSRVYVFDGGSIDLWNQYGRPLLNNDLAWQQAGRPTNVFADQTNDIVVNRGNQAPTWILNGTGSEGMHSWWGSIEFGGPEDRNSVNPLNQEADGWTFLDERYIPADINTAYNQATIFYGEAVNLNLQQKLLENLYLDIAYQAEELFQHSDSAMSYIDTVTLEVDANMYLPDGVTPNPNAGRYYFEGNHGFTKGEQYSEDSRAALSYEYDFAEKHQENKILKWLGRHRMAALVSSAWTEQRQQGLQYRIAPRLTEQGALYPNIPNVNFISPYQLNPDGSPVVDADGNFVRANGRPRFVNQARNRIRTRYYVGDGHWIPNNNFTDGDIITITDHDGESWAIDPINTGFYNEQGQRLVNQGFSPEGKQKQETVQFSYQGYLWEDRIVATYGWRKDMVRASNLINASVRDDWTGMRPYYWDLDWDGWSEAQTGITETIGVIAAPLRDIIDIPAVSDIVFFYNESSTFQPNVNFYSPQGRQYPGALGDGHDYGVRLELFDGKFTLRWNEYENTQGPIRAANTPFNRHRWGVGGIVNRVGNLWSGLNLEEVAGVSNDYVYNTRGNGDPYWMVSFTKAKGREVSVDWRVTDNLDIRFNYTEMDVVESDIGLEWWEWEDNFVEIVSRMSVPEGGENNPTDIDGDGVVGTWTWDTAWFANNNNETLAARWARLVDPGGSLGRALIEALDGQSNEFVRAQRANLNWNYRFSDRLKGWRLGGGIRWRPAPLVSYGATVLEGGATAPDLEHKIYGDDETKLDLSVGYNGSFEFPWLGERDFNVSLNIRNVTEPGPAPQLKDVEGNPIRMIRPEPRNFILQFEMDI
ncbi:MAG: TonB-dependent receptor plug domain-containing protein [Opitutales bacterium]|nr:TonB-dependent receptor plug domain-containing protein [Opitutales bacterium]